MRRFAQIAIIAILSFATPSLAQNAPANGVISLTGTGEITGKPDMAIVMSGVVTTGKTAREALNANTEAMSRIFEVLQAAKIELSDIQTSNFNVRPQYVYSDRRDENGYQFPPRISGYQVANTLSVQVRDLDNLGTLLDNAVSVGSNQINSISFAVSDTAPLLSDARRAAMADAVAKAELYTDAAGVSLGKILSISETGAIFTPPPQQMEMAARMQMDTSSVPVAAGELSFSKNITVVWELLQN